MSLQQKRGLGRVFYVLKFTKHTKISQYNTKNLAVPPPAAFGRAGRAIRSYAHVATGHALRLHEHTASIPHRICVHFSAKGMHKPRLSLSQR
jgi:hypothetical protein